MKILTAERGVPTSYECTTCACRFDGSPDDLELVERLRHARGQCEPLMPAETVPMEEA